MKAMVVGAREGVHEKRFVRAFRERGLEANFVSFDSLPRASLNADLEAKLRRLNFLFGGPLHLHGKCSAYLSTVPYIAAAYAYDLLHEAPLRPEATSSVAEMLEASRGLVVDCEVVATAAKRKFSYSKPILIRAWGLERAGIEQCKLHIHNNSPVNAEVEEKMVLSVRNFTELHGIMDVIHGFYNAAAVNPTLRLVMAGDGPMRPQVESAIQGLGLSSKVSLLGSIPEPELAELICKAGIYVSASLVDGTSVSLLQALDSGIPVILSNVGGNPEWAKRVDGADLFEAGDAIHLGNLIAERVGSPRFDRSQVLQEFANWKHNADDIVEFCSRLAQ